MSTQQAPRPSLLAGARLEELTQLFEFLHAEDIRYCHWKSNEHLGASMAGRTDLDLLVDRKAARPLATVLDRTSFVRFSTQPERGYPGIESYLGLDAESGGLLHLHLHYQLTVGEKHLKGYRLTWEDRLLSTRVFDETEQVYVADPHLELLLLVVRAALKLRVRDHILAWAGRDYMGGNTLREMRWLAARVSPARLTSCARELVGEKAAVLLAEMVGKPVPSIGELRQFACSVEPSLREYRTYGAAGARWRRWWREARRRWSATAGRSSVHVSPTRRVLPQGGLVIAFIGADGSGKSTVARAMSQWLDDLVDVVPVYFGTGQGPASLPRRGLQAVAAVVRRSTKPHREPLEASWRGKGTSTFRTAGELLWVLALSRERRTRIAIARRARNRGMIVLCDRFPQSHQVGNDGPCLGHWIDHSSWVRRTVAREELAALRLADRLRPDLIIKLNIAADVALQRKPDTPPAMLYAKLRVLEQWRVAEGTRIVEIDATLPFERVLLEVKRAIWNAF